MSSNLHFGDVQIDVDSERYSSHHKPASCFPSRSRYLDHELQILNPRRWALNLPGRDFRFEWEDLVPAIAGTIGIIAMYSAVMSSYAAAYGLGPDFVVENVRVEMLISASLFCILISGFMNPRANLAGNHGPMIPMIGMIAAAGGHPLALAILLGGFGLALSLCKGGSRLVKLTSDGVAGGLLIFLGFVGSSGQIKSLLSWGSDINMGYVATFILFVSIVLYAFLARIGKRWLAIPVCAVTAGIIAAIMGAPFEFHTTPGLPNLNPAYWWGSTETGWKLGMPTVEHFIASLPFALLAVAMWSPDFLGHRIFQEMNYPEKAEKALMDVDDTMTGCSVRQIVGAAFGGGNVTSSWGTYMIPAAIAKRPIPAGAILLGSICIVVAIIGYPMDIAIWPPVMTIALLAGVFLPLLEAGMQMVKDARSSQSAGICIFASMAVNPVFGWAVTMLLDNNGLIGDKERPNHLTLADRIIIPGLTLLVCLGAMLAVGMIPGIPALLG
ncbi:DUF3360 family protein [Photobacterium sp. 2_MG-2023]|uniref:DUF3360 family protein n=1 Tax=unclassified Photobacterium TaxID=2628852 RepID=UPI001C461CA1|nr:MULTISPECIES: DUF3360 family protein [unclassified Photobacterium]MBV7260558.1 DUF3360 family protein [Photobacterium sp. WH24]MDO6580839.1 DUF3360 family protein [Photobacterium sp. 2_MG-2023]